MKLYKIAWRNVRRNGRRSLLSGSAIGIAAMAIVLMFALIAGMKDDLAWNVQTYSTGRIRVRHKDFDENEQLNPLHLRVMDPGVLVEKIDSLEGVSAVSPRINFPGLADPNDKNVKSMGVGVDFKHEIDFQDIPKYLKEGRVPVSGSKETLIGSGLARKLDVDLGDKFTVITTTMRRSPNAMTFEVAGIIQLPYPMVDNLLFFVSLDRAQKLTGLGDAATEILVKFDDSISDKKARAAVQSVLREGGDTTARNWTELNALVAYISLAQMIYNYIGFIFFLLASTVIINTTMMVIFERTREIGTIGAMGMKGGEIVKLFFLEAAMIGVMGSFVGTIVGTIFAWILSKTGINLAAAMEGVNMEISGVMYTKLNLRSTVLVFFFGSIIAALASLLPSRRAAKIEPAEALRHF